jgi:hypothetical protein
MNASRLEDICARKESLVNRCASQRATIAQAWAGIESPLVGATQTAGKVMSTVRSPLFIAGVGLVALRLSKSNLLRIPMLIWRGAKLARRVHAILR